MAGHAISFAGADGLTLRGMAAGPADGTAVLLAHGGGQTHWAWRRTVVTLAEAGFRAIALDLRGHGQSDRATDGDYGNDAVARDWLAVTAQVGGKPHMVGASLGGIAGLVGEGLLAPGSFASLTLVDITARPNMDGIARIQAFMSAHVDEGFASLEDAAAAIASYTSNREKRAPSDSLSRYLNRDADGRYRWHWDPALMASFEVAGGEQRAEMETAARALELPVHLVRGGASDLVTEEDARDFLTMCPHARYSDIAGAGHMVVGDRNDAFGAAVVAFLAEQA